MTRKVRNDAGIWLKRRKASGTITRSHYISVDLGKGYVRRPEDSKMIQTGTEVPLGVLDQTELFPNSKAFQ